MPQIKRVTLALLCMALIILSLQVGIQLSNHLAQARTTTLDRTFLQTTTIFGSNLTKTVTYYGNYYGPNSILIGGQINTINSSVSQLLFENSGNVYSANLTYYGGSSSNASEYWNGSAYVPTGFSAYWATGFSVTVPNNQNYSIIADFGNNVTAPAGYYAFFNNTDETANLFISCTNTERTNPPILCQLIDYG
jgi:hypothetical protein